MRKKTFAVTALFAASYISVSSVFNIISSFTDGGVIYNLKPLYRTLYDLRPLFLIFFGFSVLFMILANSKKELGGVYKITTGICLFLAFPDIYYRITNLISTASPLQKGVSDLSKPYFTIEYVYISIISQVFSVFLSVLIIIYCVFSLYKIKKYFKILSIAAVSIVVVLLINSLYFYLYIGNFSFINISISVLVLASETIMLIYGFRKVEEQGISINRQTGFIIASIINVLICIKDDLTETMTYLYILFPIIVFCLVNVVTDLIIGKKYKDENNSIIYTKKIKTIICAISLIINCIIMTCIYQSVKGDWGELILLPIFVVYFISNIVLASAMRLGFLRVVLLGALSILPYIAYVIMR